MAVKAVMRAWQMDRQHHEPIPREDRPRPAVRGEAAAALGWSRPTACQPEKVAPWAEADSPAVDGFPVFSEAQACNRPDDDEDPAIRIEKRDDIVPRRPVISSELHQNDSFWTSHLFWKGILVGALSVLLVKTAIAVQAPFGVDWYGF